MENDRVCTADGGLDGELTGKLYKNILHVPEVIQGCSGIRLKGRLLKSFVFTTDVAIAHNCNADAVFAVYPFTPLRVISQAVILSSNKPVVCGVGGGVTAGERAIDVAIDAELNGASAVVLNHPASNANIEAVKKRIGIPVVVTVISSQTNVHERIRAGADILNVAGGPATARLVEQIRRAHPALPILATGGKKVADIEAVIQAGANAVTYTPPSCAELFRELMQAYREEPIKHGPSRGSKWWVALMEKLRNKMHTGLRL